MENAVTGVRRTTVAARLRALYGTVDKVDAFVGMVAERHRSTSDLGPLQAAIWSRQFQALRDGDRYFFANDRGLAQIQAQFGITFRHSLAELVATDSGAKVQPDVFKVVFTAN